MLIIEEELSKLTHLTDLTLHVSKHTILTAQGYQLLSNTVINLIELKSLSIKIDESCSLENEGLGILQGMINHLPEVIKLKFEIGERNYITAEAAQKFLDSLSANTKLTSLDLDLKQIRRSEEENIHFWRGLSNLNNNLETLILSFNSHHFGYSDLIELFVHLANLIKLRNLSLILDRNSLGGDTRIIEELFSQIGKMVELRSLQIKTYDITLSNTQRKEIIRNLSNLNFLQNLKLHCIERHLFQDNFDEYINFIKGLKHLQEFSFCLEKIQVLNHNQIISLGQALLELKNLVHFELDLQHKDNNTWRGFIQDLSSSLRQMHNLLNLNILLKIRNEEEFNILGESLQYLNKLEKLQIQKGLSHHPNISRLSNLKELEIYSNEYNCERQEILFDYILKLNQLEKLQLGSYFDEDSVIQIEPLCNALMSLRKLKTLMNLSLEIANNEHELNMLEQGFENLSELEYLQVYLTINQTEKEKIGLRNISLIKNLANLKRIEIDFREEALNIFGSSALLKYKLEVCSLNFNKRIRVQKLIEILDSLSAFPLRKLKLTINVIDCKEKQEQFEEVFKKMSSLEKLSIQDKIRNSPILYLNSVKELKSLKKLNVQFDFVQSINRQFRIFLETLAGLRNLQELRVELISIDVVNTKVRDILQSSTQAQFKHLKILDLNYEFERNDESFRWGIYAFQPFSFNQLERKKNNNKSLRYQEEMLQLNQTHSIKEEPLQSEQTNLNINSLKEKEDNKEIDTQEFNPTSLSLIIEDEQCESNKLELNAFDFCNPQYLKIIDFTFSQNSDKTIELVLLTPLRDLQSEWRLVELNLKLGNLMLSEEQISYMARNLKYLTHIQQLLFSTDCFQDYYHHLFDSFSCLTHLDILQILTNITENGAISLGNSLKQMKQLSKCQIDLIKNSTNNDVAGISSIFSGLKHATRLIELQFEMHTILSFNEDSYIPISECISNFKFLQILNLSIWIEHLETQQFRQIMASIGSLEFLGSLDLTFQETNPFKQDELDELIKAINKLKYLKQINVSLYLENNTNIKISEEFATLFNNDIHQSNCVTIIAKEKDQITLQQEHSIKFLFKSKTIQNVEITFLEYLNERKKVWFEIFQRYFMKNISMCAANYITLNLFYEEIRFEEEEEKDQNQVEEEEMQSFYQVCEFLQKSKNIFQLVVEGQISSKLDYQNLIQTFLLSLSKLQTLKIFIFNLYQTNINSTLDNEYRSTLVTQQIIQYIQRINIRLIIIDCLFELTNW